MLNIIKDFVDTISSYNSVITLKNDTDYTINFRIVGSEGTNQNFILEPGIHNINVSSIKTINKFTAGSEASALTAKMHGCHPPVPSLQDKEQYLEGWIVDLEKGTNVEGETEYLYRRKNDSRPSNDQIIMELWIGSTYPLSSFVQHTLEIACQTTKQSATNKNVPR